MNYSRYKKGLAVLLISAAISGCAAEETADIYAETQAELRAEEVKSTDTLLENMSLREKVGQLFIVRPDALDFSLTLQQVNDTAGPGLIEIDPDIEEAVRNYPPGGIIIFSKNIASPEQLIKLNSELQKISRLPLFISVDEEGGQVSRLANHPAFKLEKYESAFSVGLSRSREKAEEMGRSIGKYLKKYGFNMDFAPVADVNTNPMSPIIGARAFSSDAEIAADMAEAMAEGLRSRGIIPVFKHFPGHGSTAGDSHSGIAVCFRTEDELEKCEWLPFRKASEEDCIMAGHIAVPDINGDNTAACMSEKILSGILREKLGFKGLIITDSFSMKAITDNYTPGEAALTALKAGCDIILMPEDYRESFNAVLTAAENGELSLNDIDNKVKRILDFKKQAGIIK